MQINPNIALGVRPIEQPNMLGQMAQAMQIRQANQEYDDVNAMRSISAKYGGDISNPDFLKEVGMRNPKTAADLRAKALANDKTTGEIVKSRLETSRELLSNVRTPEEYLAWHQGNHKDPLLGPLLASKGITADTSMATIQESLKKPGGFEELLKKSAMGLDKFYQDQTSRYSTNVAAGTAANRLKFDIDRDTREQEQLKAVLGIVSPERTSSATALPINMGGGGAPTTQMPPAGGVQTPTAGVVPVTPPAAGVAPVTPPAGAVTPSTGAVGQPNVLATQVAPPTTSVPVPTTVNNLGQGSQKEQLVDQISQLARIPTTAASRALDMKVKEFNVLYPTEKIEQDKQGNLITIVNGQAKPVVDARGLPVQGKPLPETAFEKSVGAEVGKDIVAFVKRVEAAPKNITKIDEALSILKSGGAVTGFGAEARLNLERAMSLFGNDVKSGKRVVDTQILDALLGSDVFPSLQAMGLGSKNIDTPNEREYIRQVITGSIQFDNDALIRLTQIRRKVETDAIKEYNQKLDSGKFDKYSKSAGQKLEKIEVPNPIIRKGKHKNGRSVIEYADGTVEYGN